MECRFVTVQVTVKGKKIKSTYRVGAGEEFVDEDALMDYIVEMYAEGKIEGWEFS